MTTNSSSNIPTGASNTVLQGQGVGSASAFSTATYPATTTINQVLYSSSANVVAGLATANSGAFITSAAGVPSVAALTDGQLIIGSSAGAPTAGTITAGTGVSVTNGHNSITIASTAGTGITWNDSVATPVTVAVNNGYIADNGASQTVFNLPATCALGSVFVFQGKGSGGWQVVANTGQTIHLGSQASTSGGTITSTNQYDSLYLVCITANTTYATVSAIGNLTYA